MFEEFGAIPEGFELVAGDLGEGDALLASELFHLVEAASEFGGSFLKGEFRVDMEEAGKVDGDEEDVAKFGFDAG